MKPQKTLSVVSLLGVLFFPIIWVVLSYVVNVPERYLPTPISVLEAAYSIEPNILIHAWTTLARLLMGFTAGTLAGIILGIYLYRFRGIREFLLPSLHSLRALPPVAAIPFLLLWFGFSDIGKYLLIIFGCGVNLAFTSYQILLDTPQKYLFSLESCKIDTKKMPWNIALPLVIDRLLPTMRYSLATAIGLIIVSEFLGAQIGLGYVMQSARSTFSLQSIFLCAILLAVIASTLDYLLVFLWKKIIFWRPI